VEEMAIMKPMLEKLNNSEEKEVRVKLQEVKISRLTRKLKKRAILHKKLRR